MKTIRTFAALIFAGFALPAYAQDGGGLSRLTESLTTIEGALNAISVVTVTIALLIFGFMLLFRATQITWLAQIIGGCIVIGGAAQIANFFLGS